MVTAVHQKLTAEHGKGVADRVIGHNIQASILHKDIIEKWGRFPHRCGADLNMPECSVCRAVGTLFCSCYNKMTPLPYRNEVLGRDSTPEEVTGLADGSIRSF